MGLATISILFSGVAATVLAASSNHEPTAINQAVNTLWFSSILLGICSAASCVLGMEWHSITGWTPRPSDPGLVQTFRFILKGAKCSYHNKFSNTGDEYTSRKPFITNTES